MRDAVIPRKLRKPFAVVAGALVAGVPVAMIQRGVDTYIERQATEDSRLSAQRAIARAEWRIGQSIATLAAIGAARLTSCADIEPDAVRRAVMATTPLKEVLVVDETGVPRCLPATRGAQPRVLSRELATADDRVFLSVVLPLEAGERALRIRWQRAGDPLFLSGHVPADVFLPDNLSSKAASEAVVRVMLNEGTLIAAPFDKEEGVVASGDSIIAHNQSTRYPLVVTATVSRAAVFAEHADLRAIAIAGGAVLALLIIALAVLVPLRGRSNPIVAMERALEAGEFVPYYQPLVDLRSGAVVGAEVLMRWRKPDGSLIPPAAFIPLAESSGLILEMTKALMITARDEIAPALGLRPRVKIGFNLTAHHFANETIVEDVREVFAGSPIRLSQLVFEVTERQPLEDLDMARRVIAALQELGCKIAIDDVGTGHGGLSYMLKLGVNYIKIDKLFVDAIGTERYSTTIIETLINLARSMGLEIFAEGVETFDQVKYLRDRGIFLAQGYAFAPPLPGPLFRQLLEAAHPLGTGVSENTAPSPAAVGEFIAARDRVAAA
jgi:sensor c-di-GMP phosphodiesterase-like protein